ncbi:MAG: tetratricopeptide repeat protein [Candidatus Aminicenantes bacterium]|nr:MAG: tetratricopeptide repeat protein [Candidatus Aminicenantes bacterium]
MINKKLFVILILVFLSVFKICLFGGLIVTQGVQEKSKKNPEVISLLWKKLFATPAKGEELLKLRDALKEAAIQVEANPENPENIVMYGRRLAYLWRYHEAIEVFSKGVENHPDFAMLYRHRGHRYISIRKFEKAFVDLTRASKLNDHDFDIWYHLGLAHFLLGEFEEALSAYKNCMKAAEDDDSKIAISNWLYITLRRLGNEDDAAKILDGITEEMEVVENRSYYNLLLFYKGRKSEIEITALAEASDIDMATIGYGIGCWYLYNESIPKARTFFEKIVNTTMYWPAFGFIAAEAELVRM